MCPSCELECIASLPHLQPGLMSKTRVFGKVTAELQHTQSHGGRNVNVWGGRRCPTTGPFVIVRISFWNTDFGPAGNFIYIKKVLICIEGSVQTNIQWRDEASGTSIQVIIQRKNIMQ